MRGRVRNVWRAVRRRSRMILSRRCIGEGRSSAILTIDRRHSCSRRHDCDRPRGEHSQGRINPNQPAARQRCGKLAKVARRDWVTLLPLGPLGADQNQLDFRADRCRRLRRPSVAPVANIRHARPPWAQFPALLRWHRTLAGGPGKPLCQCAHSSIAAATPLNPAVELDR